MRRFPIRLRDLPHKEKGILNLDPTLKKVPTNKFLRISLVT